MELQDTKIGNALAIRVSERLDATTANSLDAHCQQAIGRGERSLILDFGSLDYLSSAGLRCILSTAKKLKSQGGTITLACAHGVVKEVLEISGFLNIFPYVETLGSSEVAAR